MPRPKSKEELLSASKANYNRLIDYIESLPKENQEATFSTDTLNKNIRDVLCHLHHWHLMSMTWYEIGLQDKKPEMPAPGYTWKTTPELNLKINKDYQAYSLSDAKDAFQKSHTDIINIISKHSDEELFTKKKYKWTGSTSMGAYFVSAAYSHYDWAYKIIKKGLK